ncbi:competence/damage-inducible protein A [Conexibacter sp. DBS9H8]|uniref:competence/damage-inducible protein A n=1 Tax=Conexibacter sp. DBS9H8 TaxID=2937801 RepID=UPI00200CD430|nr:competence/damage-inducible protein A [Conexibacter sp. DBS9H8]
MDAAVYTGRAAVRAGILVTGTEVLTGIITDRNGPWLSERLREIGVDVAGILVVGDRPDDVMAGLRFFAAEGVALIVTSGGLGPTADDLTAEIVARFRGRELVLDRNLEEGIEAIIARLRGRYVGLDQAALSAANRKQALVPEGATVLAPVGTAPGLVVVPAEGIGGPTVLVLPGPPAELKPMWATAQETAAFQAAVAGAPSLAREMMRLYGIPEAEIANTLRAAAESGVDLSGLEITTCLRRGEIEVSTRFSPDAAPAYAALKAFIIDRHGDVVFSPDGATIDAIVADALVAAGATLAVAESCTAGLLAARLTERPGASASFRGGIVAYANDAKTAVAGVDGELIRAHGAVSGEVALALADGARQRFASTYGVGITGIAGPGGGSEEKPVGTVWFGLSSEDGRTLVRHVRMPGDRTAVRDRSTTVVMHLLARMLAGAGDRR